MKKNRYKDWFAQAGDDLKWAEDSLRTGHFAGVCFLAQQTAAKSLRALAYYRGVAEVRNRSVKKIAESLDINSEIARAGGLLDQYYIATRYPDALPEGRSSEYYDKEQAAAALEMARAVIRRVQAELGADLSEK